MPRIDDYFDAIADLGFVDHPWREGTCPSCRQYGFTLKLLDLKGTLGIGSESQMYEPWCDRCTYGEIAEAVAPAEPAAKAA